MTKILLGCIKWLRFTGIIASTDIGSVPAWVTKSRKRFVTIAADLRIFWHFLMAIIVLVPQIAYMLFRAAEVLEVAQVFYPVAAVLGQYDSATVYGLTEARLAFYCKIYERLVYLTLTIYVTVPAILEIRASRDATRTFEHQDVDLLNDLYFFNTTSSPIREICYFALAVGISGMIVLAITADLLFGGLCLYIVAMYKELQRIVRCIDQKGRQFNSAGAVDLRQILSDCIDFHLAIISFTDTINDIYSHVIFVQYASSLLGMCCNIFVMFLVSGSRMLKTAVTIICFVVGLLIYCWIGQLVHDETINLQNFIYDLRWYEYGLTEQKMIKLMILRTQKPCGLAGYNYFNCDLPTFFNIMTNAYSLVSFLQGML